MAAGTVAVVGAGLSGLAAATELKRRGFTVEVFERSRLLGGKATSFLVDGIEIDNGQHVYLGCCVEWLDFVDQLGLSDQLYLQPRFEVLLLTRGDRPRRLRAANLPAPGHLLPVLLRYPGLSWREKLSLARALLQAHSTVEPGSTFADWLERNRQDQASRRNFWEPFLVPALNAPFKDVSAEAAMFVVRTAFLAGSRNARIGYSRVPLAKIAAVAAKHADRLHLRTPVSGLTTAQGQIDGIRLEDGRRLPFGAVVLAVPPASLARLLAEPEVFGIHGLDHFHSRAIVDVHLWYDDTDLTFDFAAVRGSPLQWVFRKAPGYLCCSLSAADAYAGWAERALVDLCRDELAASLPALTNARLKRGVATRDREATFIPTPGLKRPGQATAMSNLAIAGAWTETGWPATMESAVRSGRAAARVVAAAEVRRAA